MPNTVKHIRHLLAGARPPSSAPRSGPGEVAKMDGPLTAVTAPQRPVFPRVHFGRFLKEMLNRKEAVRGIVRVQGEVYDSVRARDPELDPHVLLARVWLSRATTPGSRRCDPNLLQQVALNDTFLFSCLPEGDNVRALGLYIAQRESPKVFSECPDMVEEYALLMKPLYDSVGSGDIFALYRSRNPHMVDEEGDELSRLVRELELGDAESPLLLPLTVTAVWKQHSRDAS